VVEGVVVEEDVVMVGMMVGDVMVGVMGGVEVMGEGVEVMEEGVEVMEEEDVEEVAVEVVVEVVGGAVVGDLILSSNKVITS
jgi:hypothetical protein